VPISLFSGSDTPRGIAEIELRKIKALQLTEEQQKLALGVNRARILDL
jgi:hypothetical protein